MEEQQIQDKLYEIIKEFSKGIEERNKEKSLDPNNNQEPTTLECVSFYARLELPGKNGFKVPVNNVYIVEEKTGKDTEYKIYLSDPSNLIGTARKDKKGNFNVEYSNASIKEATGTTDLEKLTQGEDKYTAEFVEQQELLEESISAGISNKEAEQIAQESETAEELEARIELGIVVGSTKNISQTEAEDFPEFKEKKLQFGYSKKLHEYVVYDVETAEPVMEADMNEKGVSITKVERDGTTTTQVHDVVLSSTKNRNNPKKLTMKIGAYGNLILSEADKNRDGTMVASDIRVEGGDRRNSEIDRKLDQKDNREAIGETSDEYERYNVSSLGRIIDQQEFDEFFERFQQIVGPCPVETAEELLKNAEGETLDEKLQYAVEQKRSDDMKALQARKERINSDTESLALGEKRNRGE